MNLSWLNAPPDWRQDGATLTVTTGDRTDFWSRTIYGFVRDNGHFRFAEVAGDFTAEVEIAADYRVLYDQAGLMLRVDGDNWIKTGIELTDGALHYSTVITREGYSDWSQQPLPDAARQGIGVRLTRQGEALRVHFKLGDDGWRPARLGMLTMPEKVQVGMMCCTPERAGLQVTFRNFNAGPPISRELHAP